ncbi:sensor histidine kinase YesM [Paenibacillus marchantiophytorum]|uniref:histidine kinase n=1 Tax=Paenibacillus marchantiophytorum TaxID=1619310 RepID=A0ABQ1EUY7_9BACL|nr:sensor histidine kinase [Paenibacillus marchantiophytorum]GFZ88697.1 sensor histidine kinase YesM [Paenibacillus marchantiophytorum]
MAQWSRRLHALELKTKLTLLLLIIAVIPLAFLGTFSYRKASSEIQIKACEIILENLSQVNYSLTYFVKDIEQLSMYIYSNRDIQKILAKPSDRSMQEKYQDEQTVNQILKSFLGFKVWDIELYVLGENGDRYFTGDLLPNVYRDYNPNWGLIRKARMAGGSVVWDTNYSLKKMEDYGAVLSSGRQLKQVGSGLPLGYFVVNIMEPALAYKYDKAHQYPGGEVYLLDSNGYIISSLPYKQQVGTRLDKPYMTEVLQGKKGFFRNQVKDSQSDNMVIYDTSDTSGFKLVSVIPVNALTQESSSIRNLTIFIVLSGMLISYCLAYLLAEYITRPLRKLRLLMKDVEKGNLDVVFTSKYQDEVGHLGLSFNKMLQRIKHLIDQIYAKQLKVQEAELKAIQAQFTPHFLYNALDSINWMARIHRIETISNTAVALGELLRFSINRGHPIIQIREDLKQIHNYLKIQEVRYRDKIEVQLHIHEDILDLYVPKLLIQPIVENAISHGLEMKKGSGFLKIEGKRVDNWVQIIVEDNGVGIAQWKLATLAEDDSYISDREGKTGIGLSNLRRRLALHFGSSYQLGIESEVGVGTKVLLRIPVITHPSEVDTYV